MYHSCSCPHASQCVSLPIYYTCLELLLIPLKYFFLCGNILWLFGSVRPPDPHCTLSVTSVITPIYHSVISGVLVCLLGRLLSSLRSETMPSSRLFPRTYPWNVKSECDWNVLVCWMNRRMFIAGPLWSIVWYDRQSRPGCSALRDHNLVGYPGHISKRLSVVGWGLCILLFSCCVCWFQAHDSGLRHVWCFHGNGEGQCHYRYCSEEVGLSLHVYLCPPETRSGSPGHQYTVQRLFGPQPDGARVGTTEHV